MAGVLVGLGCLAPGAEAAAPSFASHVDYSLGTVQPENAATGDFNEDGNLDVIAAASGSSVPLKLLLGNGKGGLGTPADVSNAGLSINGVEVADFNRDGYLDLLTFGGSGGASVALGDGKGGFGARTELDTGGGVSGAEIADLNKDQNPDIVTAGIGIRTFLGNGSGGFAPKDNKANSDALKATTGDLDGDGNLDVIVSTLNKSFLVLLGDGTGAMGTPKSYEVGTDSNSATVGDFTGDGKLDVVADNFNQPAVSLFPGDGTGKLNAKSQITTSARFYRLQSADLNNDGKRDVVGENSSPSVGILQGTGQSLANEVVIDSVSDARAPALGDLNNDGKVDMVTPNGSSKSVSVLLNTTDVTPPVTSITAGPSEATNNPNPAFAFTSSEEGSTFKCSFSQTDGGGAEVGLPTPCTSAKSYGPLSEGPTYTFEVQAFDKAGNPGNKEIRTFVLDRTAPGKPRISSPTSGSTLTNGSFSVSGTAEPKSTVEVFDGSTSLGTVSAGSDGNWSKALAGVANGSHSYTARATDVATNVSPVSDAVTVTVATQSGSTGGGSGSTGGGSGSTGGGGINPSGNGKDVIAPALSAPKLSATTFAVDTKAKASAAAKKTSKGTTLSFKLSEAAKVSIATQQKVKGKWRTLSTFTKSLKAGKQKVKYSGRIKVRRKAKSLKPGRYRMQVQPIDAAGNKGKPITIAFRIVKGG